MAQKGQEAAWNAAKGGLGDMFGRRLTKLFGRSARRAQECPADASQCIPDYSNGLSNWCTALKPGFESRCPCVDTGSWQEVCDSPYPQRRLKKLTKAEKVVG